MAKKTAKASVPATGSRQRPPAAPSTRQPGAPPANGTETLEARAEKRVLDAYKKTDQFKSQMEIEMRLLKPL